MRERAELLGVSLARLMVESGLDTGSVSSAAERHATIRELLELRRLLANATGNLNQVAHVANMAGQVVVARRALEVLDAVDAASSRIEAAVR